MGDGGGCGVGPIIAGAQFLFFFFFFFFVFFLFGVVFGLGVGGCVLGGGGGGGRLFFVLVGGGGGGVRARARWNAIWELVGI